MTAKFTKYIFWVCAVASGHVAADEVFRRDYKFTTQAGVDIQCKGSPPHCRPVPIMISVSGTGTIVLTPSKLIVEDAHNGGPPSRTEHDVNAVAGAFIVVVEKSTNRRFVFWKDTPDSAVWGGFDYQRVK